MIKLGRYNKLRVTRFTDNGAYLTDDATENPIELLLPGRYVTQDLVVGDEIEVFVYTDSEDRLVATTEHPFVQAGEFAFLQVVQVNRIGAFVDWGLSKNLLVPFSEQKYKMREDGVYLIYAYVDDATNRVVATGKVAKYLDNKFPDYKPGDEVQALVCEHTEIGYKVIVDNAHRGMIYENELFEPLELQQTVKAYVKAVRESDNRIDLTLTQPGTGKRVKLLDDQIIEMLKEGKMALTDKSSPEEIKAVMHCSKKDFKKAVGALYRRRIITIDDNGQLHLAPIGKKQ